MCRLLPRQYYFCGNGLYEENIPITKIIGFFEKCNVSECRN